MIHGSKLSLRPAKECDRKKVYEWLTHSDVTPSMMGPADYPDHPIPAWENFCSDYLPHYFDDSAPYLGRCFIIVVGRKDIGVVSYNRIDRNKKETELDIWLCSEAYCGKGYGSDALETVCKYLHGIYGVIRFIIRPSARNKRAIAAYKRAGFKLHPITMERQIKGYGQPDVKDAVVLIKEIKISHFQI